MTFKDEISTARDKWIKNAFLSFALCAFILFLASELIKIFQLPEKTIFIIFLPCGAFYLKQIISNKNIRCPNCDRIIFNQFNLIRSVPENCPSCHYDGGAKEPHFL